MSFKFNVLGFFKVSGIQRIVSFLSHCCIMCEAIKSIGL